KRYTGEKKTRYKLVIAGKSINFSLSSGIGWDSYDKIIVERNLRLSDDSLLPAAIVKETYLRYDRPDAQTDAEKAQDMLQAHLEQRLTRLTDGAETVKREFECSEDEDSISVTMRAECIEQIGVQRPMTGEEINNTDNETEIMHE
ncbi:MAG: sporulation protein YqfD, partial [Oscillospiraceae bacterium]|nr:sporulation protein YqfD [Oscillospiraceae bacterium]